MSKGSSGLKPISQRFRGNYCDLGSAISNHITGDVRYEIWSTYTIAFSPPFPNSNQSWSSGGKPFIFLRELFDSLAHRNPAAICAICDCDAHRGPKKSLRFWGQDKAMLHCDFRVRWKIASDLRFRAEPKPHSFCWNSGDLTPSIQKSLAIAIVRFSCAKLDSYSESTAFLYPIRNHQDRVRSLSQTIVCTSFSRGFVFLKGRHWTSQSFWSEIWGSQGGRGRSCQCQEKEWNADAKWRPSNRFVGAQSTSLAKSPTKLGLELSVGSFSALLPTIVLELSEASVLPSAIVAHVFPFEWASCLQCWSWW